ncbi:MAG: type VI secretion system baseplate subunit TssF, partial [Deltaproteobacteria bacterium]|nr:type VI secretion system baseplate subunit TssF [Deltaproteobacteria bacterium]
MADELLTYYEQELSFLRQMGAEFAAQYPKIAGRLLLEPTRCEDPHVERLIQAFAMVAARIRNKLDDEFPELTDALLQVLYPHYLAPLPSFSIAQFVIDPDQGKLTGGHRIDQGQMLLSQAVGGSPCRFRTGYPVTLWPLEVTAARFDAPDRLNPPPGAAAVIRLELKCLGGTKFSELELDTLRFFLNAEAPLAFGLYELLFCNLCQVQVRAAGGEKTPARVVLPPGSVRAVGFDSEEGLLPYTARSFLGYRLLQEYFAYPEKFLFFDLTELKRAVRMGFGDRVELLFFLNRGPRLEQPLNADTFRLGCAPVINLFNQIAEPIRVDRAQTEYRVIPDLRRQNATEIYTIDSVTSVSPYQPEPVTFQPFYSFKHTAERERQQAFWYMTRRPSPRKGDTGTDAYISLVDLNYQPTWPSVETLTLHTTCTNRDLPGKLPFGHESGPRGDFQLERPAPVIRIQCLKKPTEAARAPLRRSAHWRLLSHLALNYLSICEGGRAALQEILQLYDFWGTATQQQIEGIADIHSRRVVARPPSMGWNGFCRGLEVTIEFDEEKYVGSGVFLLASVLERFLGLYSSLNSFSQLVATSKQRKEPLKRWPPRAGDR